MRQIGSISDSKHAATFGDYATVQGLDLEVERDDDGTYSVWVIDEEQLEQAEELLSKFQADPGAADFKGVEEKAAQVRKEQEEEEQAHQAKNFDSRDIVRARRGPAGRVTQFFMVASVALFVMTFMLGMKDVESALMISNYWRPEWSFGKGLEQLLNGQIWRLFTPILLHLSLPHIIFNMLCFVQFAGMVERIEGPIHVAVLILVMGALSNLAQYAFSGPAFGGMSGVVYGLVGYIWIRNKVDFTSGYSIHPNQWIVLIIWFFLCMFSDRIANEAHYAGLVSGIVIGFIMANVRRT